MTLREFDTPVIEKTVAQRRDEFKKRQEEVRIALHAGQGVQPSDMGYLMVENIDAIPGADIQILIDLEEGRVMRETMLSWFGPAHMEIRAVSVVSSRDRRRFVNWVVTVAAEKLRKQTPSNLSL